MTKTSKKSLSTLLPKNAPDAKKQIYKFLINDISKQDLDLFNINLAQHMIDTHWSLTQKRKANIPAIQIDRIKTNGEGRHKTIINIVSNDLAFLIDSVVAKINQRSLLIDLLLHPIVGVKSSGKTVSIREKTAKECKRQSHIHIHVKEAMSDAEMKSLRVDLINTITDVGFINRDWPQMLKNLKIARQELEHAKTGIPAKEITKHCDFLDYLYDNNFTLLGYRAYEFTKKDKKLTSKTVKNSGLGILHDQMTPAYINDHDESLPHHLQNLRRDLPPVNISKTNRISTVHRRVPMDAIAIKTYNSKGKVTGEKLFLGLFTSVTYSRSVSDVPYLREKVEEVMEMSNYLDGSHDRKALRHILEKYPRDELFQIAPKDLFDIGQNIVRLQERQRISLFMRQDPFGRYISALVYIPRDRFGTDLRKRITKVLEEKLGGECANFYTTLDDSVFARVLFMINIKNKQPGKYNSAAIEEKLQEVGQTWSERLSDALSEAGINGELDAIKTDALNLSKKYDEAFSVGYSTHYSAKQAVFDIKKIETALTTKTLGVDLYETQNGNKKQLRLKVYNIGSPLTLSDVMPILENMGLRAISELPFEIQPKNNDQAIWIHDFLLESQNQKEKIQLNDVKEQFEEAFAQIWYGNVENDKLNTSVILTGITSQETIILRTYVRYLKQIRYPFSRHYVQNALIANPKMSLKLIEYFKLSFDPGIKKDRPQKIKEQKKALKQGLQKVVSLDQDRILRKIIELIEATLRTNYYQKDENGNPKPALVIKLNSSKIPDIPQPVPFREMFVYSPRVEGIHLRGDKIARGGLRWSDRHEDFRTEILGLMKAQMVKNAVIVPVGAKGGFVVKVPTHSREEFMTVGIECYKIFIHALLDIADNLKGEKVIPPKDVVRHDSDDPYLVVAADKGTASFSDIANGIAQDYGFWLDDAFASGGSAGYDHKKMGITAKGAWESVKLHFRHLNHDIQTSDFDVTGVGDMGGDVFGNGLILSKHIRLVGAFNHLHIFCDPDPDPATSFKERQRLFKAVKGWGEYNTSLLSKGGAIFSRSDKTLKISKEIQERFDLEKTQVTPNELMRAILKARTDLLWFGGIGTYIKAEDENHNDVGDKANDSLRINGRDVRAKVMGEGANLGITQAGRIEFAQRGGRINTDFIDNSGGVDSSDHEVNIKILMSDIMRNPKHKMDIKARNILLEKMTNDIGTHVLRNNYQQSQAISLTETQAAKKLLDHAAFIENLEKDPDINLNRAIEFLPDEEEIQDRHRKGKGLTRPELSVLISYSKIQLTKDFLNTDVPDDPDMQSWAIDYFPNALRKPYATEIARHRLRREIVAMKMANSIVNRMGPKFVKQLVQKTGANHKKIARAYTIIRQAYDLRNLWDSIEALDNKVPADLQFKAMLNIARIAKKSIFWLLTQPKTLNIAKDTEHYKKGIKTLTANAEKILSPKRLNDVKQRADAFQRDGLPEKLAKQIAIIMQLGSAPDIIQLASTHKIDLISAAQTYFKVGEKFNIDWLRTKAGYANSENPFHDEAIDSVIDQLNILQTMFVTKILNNKTLKKAKDEDYVDAWAKKYDGKMDAITPFLEELRRASDVDLSMLIVANQKLRRLYTA